jgi:hypothetical protein
MLARGDPVVSKPPGNVSVIADAVVGSPVTTTVICAALTATAVFANTFVQEVAQTSVVPAAAPDARFAKYPLGTLIVITPSTGIMVTGVKTMLTAPTVTRFPTASAAFANVSDVPTLI